MLSQAEIRRYKIELSLAKTRLAQAEQDKVQFWKIFPFHLANLKLDHVSGEEYDRRFQKLVNKEREIEEEIISNMEQIEQLEGMLE